VSSLQRSLSDGERRSARASIASNDDNREDFDRASSADAAVSVSAPPGSASTSVTKKKLKEKDSSATALRALQSNTPPSSTSPNTASPTGSQPSLVFQSQPQSVFARSFLAAATIANAVTDPADMNSGETAPAQGAKPGRNVVSVSDWEDARDGKATQAAGGKTLPQSQSDSRLLKTTASKKLVATTATSSSSNSNSNGMVNSDSSKLASSSPVMANTGGSSPPSFSDKFARRSSLQVDKAALPPLLDRRMSVPFVPPAAAAAAVGGVSKPAQLAAGGSNQGDGNDSDTGDDSVIFVSNADKNADANVQRNGSKSSPASPPLSR
jgi:hypothetical protein